MPCSVLIDILLAFPRAEIQISDRARCEVNELVHNYLVRGVYLRGREKEERKVGAR